MKYQLVMIAFFCLGLSLIASAADTTAERQAVCAIADDLAECKKYCAKLVSIKPLIAELESS
uniref:Saposin B-type domain-containing protein n=1 Tax=Strigamia maritima TaxID=126957 RepID=T1JA28_STRMM